MNPTPQRARTFPPRPIEEEPLELSTEQMIAEPTFDRQQWSENRVEAHGAGGRQVLGTSLIVLAALWLAYAGWSAGRTLVGQPLSSPAVAQWIAIAAGPIA